MQFMSTIKTCVKFYFVLVFISFIAAGCSENRQHAAEKKAKEAVEKALNEYASSGSFEKAEKTLKQSLAGESQAAGEEIVLLTQGGLQYGNAVDMRSELAPFRSSIEQYLDELSSLVTKITRTQLEQIQLETVRRSRQEEKRMLSAQLDGDGNQPGLISKLNEAQNKLAQFKAKHEQVSNELSENLKNASQIQRQSDELLIKADSARGSEKADLQKQAYDILRGSQGQKGKNEYQAKVQELQDENNLIESEMAMVEPSVSSLNIEIERIRKRVSELQESDFNAKSDERLANIAATMTKFQEEFSGTLGRIEQTESQLESKVKDMTELLDAAQKDFKKITSEESLKDFGRVAGAEALSYQAKIRGDQGLWQRQLAARLTVIASGEVTESNAQLRTLAQQYLDNSDDTMANAIADYNDASNLYGKIPVKKDDFSTAVLKNRILALAQMAYLAERIEKMDVKTQTVEQAKELIDKAIKNDPSFESVLNQPPYRIVTGKSEIPAEQPKAPAEANQASPAEEITAEPNEAAAEPNKPVAEPNSTVSEPNIAQQEPNEAAPEPNLP